MMKHQKNQRGYTLMEALIVVGIIGLVSVVTIPNFISIYRSGKIKNSSRQFVQDLRSARQTSVTEYKPMKVTFTTGVGAGTYVIFSGEFDNTEPDDIAWTEVQQKTMEETVYFLSTDFKDSPDTDARIDIVFESNGKIRWTANHVTFSGSTPPQVQGIKIKTEMNVARDEYEATVTQNGRIRLP